MHTTSRSRALALPRGSARDEICIPALAVSTPSPPLHLKSRGIIGAFTRPNSYCVPSEMVLPLQRLF